MGERDDDLQQQIQQLSERLARIEWLLNVKPKQEDAPALAEPPSRPQRESTETVEPPTTPTTHVEESEPSEPPVQPRQAGAAQPPPSSPPTSPPTSPPASPPAPLPAASPAQPEPQRSTLELTIAARWFAWIGAIVIVLGAAFALREFGADLWARLTPAAKCFIIAAFGAALLAGGEYTLRRIGKLASVGLFSAGLGVLYLDAYATFQFFDPPLVSERWSFALMAIVALVGIAITWRTQFRTIGILSILAGYLVPLLLSGTSSSAVELLAYLTMLLAIGLTLSALAPDSFRVLRYVALGGHIVVAGMWMISHGRAHWTLSLVFMSMWWVAVLVESTIAATRRQSALGNPVAVFIATACYVTAGCLILDGAQPAGPDWLGIYTAAIAVLSTATAFQFGIGIEALRRPARHPIDMLSVVLLAQAGLLLAVAIALQFDGYGRSIGWLVLAVTAIELGHRLRSRGLDVFGLVVGALALFMVATIDATLSTTLSKPLWTLDAGQWIVHLDRWSLLAVGAVFITHFAAQRLRSSADTRWRPMPVIVASVGTAYWIGLCLVRAEMLASTTGFVLGAAILLAVDPVNRKPRLLEQAIIVLLLAALHWLLADAATRFGLQWSADAHSVVANGQVAVGLAIAAGILIAWLVQNHRASAIAHDSAAHQDQWSFRSALPVFAALFLLVIFAFEVDRAVTLLHLRGVDMLWSPPYLRLFGISSLAALGAAIMTWIGRARRMSPMLDTGVVLAVASAVSWLTFGTFGAHQHDGVVDALLVFNVQFGVGVICAGALVVALLALQWRRECNKEQRRACIMMAALIGTVGLWLGSLEIIRALHGDRMAVHMGLSIYWGLYAVALVVLGFIRRWPAVRYVGLAMLGLVVIKVLTVDLATVAKIWRVVSLLVTGLLAVGVSIGYAKLAPKMLSHEDAT